MRRFATLLAVMTIAASMAVPASGSHPFGYIMQCYGLEYAHTPNALGYSNEDHTQGGTCTGQVNMMEAGRKVSILETHGNFHAITSEGSMTMEWWDSPSIEKNDADGDGVPNELIPSALIGTWLCTTPGLYVQGDNNVGVGVADATSATCTLQGEMAPTYRKGNQSLVVNAQATTCMSTAAVRRVERSGECWFHGYITFSVA